MSHEAYTYLDYVHCTSTENIQFRAWPVFLLSSVAVPVILATCLGVWEISKSLWRRTHRRQYRAVPSDIKHSPVDNMEPTWSAKTVRFCSVHISGHTKTGQIIIATEFCAGITVLIIYFHQVSWKLQQTEFCHSWYERHDWQIELVCNIILLVVYGIRFVASSNKFLFLVTMYSIVNFCTIPPCIMQMILHRSWIGLRCLRAYHFLTIPTILQFFHVLQRRTILRLAQLSCLLLTVLLASAGIFHLLENMGDFQPDTPVTNRSYWDYVYFSIITLSTIGYGDISPQTTLGRIFCCFFVLCALAFFAASLPEVYLLARVNKYSGSYKLERGLRHIIVCGHLTADTISKILDDVNRTAGSDDLKIVFVDCDEPDLETETILKRHSSRLVWLQGSLLNIKDLKRAQVQEALACLISSDRCSSDPDTSDSTVVMTVASVKNFNPRTRCVVQLLQRKAKMSLLSIPCFGTKRGDAIICYQELELALIAQSCTAPGCATMLLNILRSPPTKLYNTFNYAKCRNPIMKDYLHGCLMDVHFEIFSQFFIGMKFCDAVAFCFTKLDLLLIGLFQPQRDDKIPGLLMCPSSSEITADRVGIFIAISVHDVSRASCYCDKCHGDISNVKLIVPCRCIKDDRPKAPRDPFERLLYLTNSADLPAFTNVVRSSRGMEERILDYIRQQTPSIEDQKKTTGLQDPIGAGESGGINFWSPHKEIIRVDVTGNFFWCNETPFQRVVLSRAEAAQRDFTNHVVVLVMAKPNDPRVGLSDLAVPLRSSRIKYDELKEIVLLGDPEFLEKEWPQLRNLPKITVVNGDPMNRADLRVVSVRTCAKCVVLSAWKGSSNNHMLDDKASVLAALNLRAMPFEEESCAATWEVPMIIEIEHDENVRLLRTHNHQKVDSAFVDLYLSESFMSGEAVAFSPLDSMLVTCYANPLALPVIQHLLYGFRSPHMDVIVAEGLGLMGGKEYSNDSVSPFNTCIKLLKITDAPWCFTTLDQKLHTYGLLFTAAAKCGKICLGLTRRFVLESETPGEASEAKLCIITNPQKNFILQDDDLVYVLTQ